MDKFMQYMYSREAQKREKLSEQELQRHTPGPVITISREFGCKGSKVGRMLVEAINRKNAETRRRPEPRRIVSKQKFDEAARELHVTPEYLSDMSFKDRNDMFSNLTMFLADNFYASGTRLKNTIAKYIYQFAESGNSVIIGRASEAITKDIARAIHVKLEAPLEYRAQTIARRENITPEAATLRCQEEDKKRAQFRRYFEGKRSDLEYYDLTFNVSKMTTEEIVEVIFLLGEARGFF